MEIVIINNPETIYQAKEVLISSNEDEITPNGFIQSKLIALRIKDCNFDRIYCSDLKTSKETLREIIKENEDDKVIYTAKLRERNFGVMQGKSVSFLNFVVDKKQIPFRTFKPVNGENMIDVYVRAQEILQELIVTHLNSYSVFPKFDLFKLNYISEQQERYNKKSKLTTDINKIEIKALDSTISNFDTYSINSDVSESQNQLLNKEILDQINQEKAQVKENIEEILKLIISYDFDKEICQLYKGFNKNDQSMKRILIISHSTFIQELVNSVKIRKGLDINTDEEKPKDGSVYVIRILCVKCEHNCLKNDSCKIRTDIIVHNDISHLKAFYRVNEKMKNDDN